MRLGNQKLQPSGHGSESIPEGLQKHTEPYFRADSGYLFIAVNATSTRAVGPIDIYPTLLELTGLPKNLTNEGRSLVPLLKDPEAEWEYSVLTYLGRNNTAVCSELYRYIRYEDGSKELSDRKSDPNEWNNIADDPATAAIRARLRQHFPVSQAPLSAESSFGWNAYWRQKNRQSAKKPLRQAKLLELLGRFLQHKLGDLPHRRFPRSNRRLRALRLQLRARYLALPSRIFPRVRRHLGLHPALTVG